MYFQPKTIVEHWYLPLRANPEYLKSVAILCQRIEDDALIVAWRISQMIPVLPENMIECFEANEKFSVFLDFDFKDGLHGYLMVCFFIFF
jgi:hypothetical protein